MRRVVLALLIVTTAACGGSSSGPSGPTAASVSVQQSDVPKGMVRCGFSGDIQTFIKNVQSPDPGLSQSLTTEWTQAKQDGATAAYASIYTDSSAHCSDFIHPATNPGAVPYRLVINFAAQFKDAASASNTYQTGSVFGVSASSLSVPGSNALVGAKTGLSPNSVVAQHESPPAIFLALWQNQTFDIFLAVLNIDPTTSQKIATLENSRIK